MIVIYKNKKMKKIIYLFIICFLIVSCSRPLTEYDYQKCILKEMPNSSIYKSPNEGSCEFLVVDKDNNLFYVEIINSSGGTECYIGKKQFILSFKNN